MNYALYPPNWRSEIRPFILARDKYKCQHCSLPQNAMAYRGTKGRYIQVDAFAKEWAENRGEKVKIIKLHVAHLNHLKDDIRPVNLLSLCPHCHSKHDAQHKKIAQIMFKASIKDSTTFVLNKSRSRYNTFGPAIKQIIREDYNLLISTETAQAIVNLFI